MTIVPKPPVSAYSRVLINPGPSDYYQAIQSSYVATLGKVSFIRAVFGIEREFDRYYMRLKQQLRVASSAVADFDDPKVLEFATNPAANDVLLEGNEEYEALESS